MAVSFRSLLFCFLGLSLFAGELFAQQRVDLYRAEVLVPDQSQRERNQAAVDGLAEVLVRVSGQARVLDDPKVVDSLGRAADFLVEWRYEGSDQTIDLGDRQVPAWRLVLRYSSNAIERLLRDQRLPIWPANRPSTLVWLMVDDRNGRNRVTASSHPGATSALEESARRRGIPLVKPLMDLEDQVALSAQTLWSLDQDAIRSASERYGADSILVGRLSENSQGQWRASWMLLHSGRSNLLDSEGATVEDAVAAGIDQVADYFFQIYGITPTDVSSEALLFQVDDIEDFADYSRFMDYLDGMAVVRDFELVAVRGGSMLLYIYLQGDVNLFRGAIGLDERLLPVADLASDGLPPGSPGNPLRYRWR